MQIELKKDELAVINIIRKAGPFSKFTIEKRPTKENPDGELIRIVVETSELVAK